MVPAEETKRLLQAVTLHLFFFCHYPFTFHTPFTILVALLCLRTHPLIPYPLSLTLVHSNTLPLASYHKKYLSAHLDHISKSTRSPEFTIPVSLDLPVLIGPLFLYHWLSSPQLLLRR